MIAALLPLLRHRMTWGVGIALGVLVAICAHGRLQFADGYRQGKAAEKSRRDSIETIADAVALQMRVRTDSVIASLQAELAQQNRAILVAKQASARAEGRYADALQAYEQLKAAMVASGDTVLTPRERACDAVADRCAIKLAAVTQEKQTIEAKLATTEQLVVRKDSVITTEPARVRIAAQQAIAIDRATRREPSRVTWTAVGAGLGAAAALWVRR